MGSSVVLNPNEKIEKKLINDRNTVQNFFCAQHRDRFKTTLKANHNFHSWINYPFMSLKNDIDNRISNQEAFCQKKFVRFKIKTCTCLYTAFVLFSR